MRAGACARIFDFLQILHYRAFSWGEINPFVCNYSDFEKKGYKHKAVRRERGENDFRACDILVIFYRSCFSTLFAFVHMHWQANVLERKRISGLSQRLQCLYWRSFVSFLGRPDSWTASPGERADRLVRCSEKSASRGHLGLKFCSHWGGRRGQMSRGLKENMEGRNNMKATLQSHSHIFCQCVNCNCCWIFQKENTQIDTACWTLVGHSVNPACGSAKHVVNLSGVVKLTVLIFRKNMLRGLKSFEKGFSTQPLFHCVAVCQRMWHHHIFKAKHALHINVRIKM